MRYSSTFMATGLLLVTMQLSAQQKQGMAYAITSSEKGNFNWTDVKQIDFTTGSVTRSIFDSKQTNFTVYNARTGKEIKPVTTQNGVTTNVTIPVASLSAACAYDQRHNRLYYAPLFMNQLRYIDLDEAAPKIYYFDNEPFIPVTDVNNEANHITRMVIGADGDGYALSNDANHLIRFTTGRKPVITDLGSLKDDLANEGKSIHEKTTSWGGDMIADAAGNLYVISAFRQVFKVNIQSKVATWIAEIQGMPAGFTTNGTVVDNDGQLIVSSANTAEGYYKVDMHSWQATRIDIKGTVFNASDLANGNLAFASNKNTVPLINRAIIRNEKIALYPNPVATNLVYVSFNSKESGRYTIQLVDLTGKIISEKIVVVGNGGQVIAVNVKNGLAKGPYMLKVLSNSKKTVFTDKLIVE
ncbi:T9SS type A sorting domain-containing protein [Niastella caeni]|uniref:T9SS type A sorting domain-containing protein n=1 Tax=Niastella caeni TaxID=2569763 RepID=A0A4V4H1C9_9BACT|nr:T9SS type A sorting domain-containing protein [Niastella caeni]THU39946.1 T9SS type A sorting domain-containing protein [Niastella caeni]